MNRVTNYPPLVGPIGAHTSVAGGLWKALKAGEALGADTVQLFTRNQRQWRAKPVTAEEVALFHTTQEETGIRDIMSHASYLINLGCPDPVKRQRSYDAFRQEIVRCQALGITYLNFHPGAALDGTAEECLARIVDNLVGCCDLLKPGGVQLVVETTAGQGSNVGFCFAHLAQLIEETAPAGLSLGVCIDTCHIFAAGYDIRTPAAWEKTLAEFDAVVGLQHLRAFHVNDSLQPYGSRKDRHASLGEGHIGWDAFAWLMQSPLTSSQAKYLETPVPARWPLEIQRLRDFASESQGGKK